MLSRRSLLALTLASAVSACGNVGRNGFYELIPKHQYRIVIDGYATEALLQAVAQFADTRGFRLVTETYRSAPSAPSIFWILERLEGMVVFQNKIVGEEPDPSNAELTLNQHSRTEFSAMFYRSVVGYNEEQLLELVREFGSSLSAVEGLLTFEDQFPRDA
jgi:hypothetical protein